MCAVLVAGSSHVFLHCLFLDKRLDKRKMELCYKCYMAVVATCFDLAAECRRE